MKVLESSCVVHEVQTVVNVEFMFFGQDKGILDKLFV